MFVIQFVHGSSLQKNTHTCIGMVIIIEVRLTCITIHSDSIQVMILIAMDSIEGKS